MKCTNENRRRRYRRRRRRTARKRIILCTAVAVICIAGASGGYMIWDGSRSYAADYEAKQYNCNVQEGDLFASDLCVASGDVTLNGFDPDDKIHSAGLFDIDNNNVLCGYNMFEKLYPASTTKIMTAYLALKYGNLNDTVTVSAHASDFNWDEVTCGLQEGDTVSLYDLLCGLLLHSGNDCATAIAEHISGSEEAFADLMNTEAAALGATGSHFVNPHGLHDENHYTTAYDLYLIFNQCIKDKRFVEIISKDSYTGTLTGADGTVRQETWKPTNYYSAGEADPPEGVIVIGGKTGTTDEAGNCLILYDQNSSGAPYISVIMGAEDRTILYDDMNSMMESGINSDDQ